MKKGGEKKVIVESFLVKYADGSEDEVPQDKVNEVQHTSEYCSLPYLNSTLLIFLWLGPILLCPHVHVSQWLS